MARFFNAKNLHSLPDGGLDEKGKRKQKLYTDEHHGSFKLLVTGNSRLFYSQWEKPKHMLKESQKRQPKLTPLGGFLLHRRARRASQTAGRHQAGHLLERLDPFREEEAA